MKSWLDKYWYLRLVGWLGFVSAIACSENVAFAQSSNIIPDGTLGNDEKSLVVPFDSVGFPIDVIDGGAIRDTNLFHSFQEFNVSQGRGAYFFSPSANIQNILARVTGRNPSEILGTLGTFGGTQPNLFLINPNGIIFGKNASLDVGGSFMATTANAVRLGDTGLFSASQPTTSNLLTVNPSALFFNALTSPAIINRSTANTTVLGYTLNGFPFRSINGLQVLDGQSLALVGGDVVLEGSVLTAPGGRIDLGSVAAGGLVSLKQTDNSWNLGYESVQNFAKIQLSQFALVNTSGEGSGEVQVQTSQLNMQDSLIFANTLGAKNGGSVVVRSPNAITLDNSLIVAGVGFQAIGRGGNITVETGKLSVSGDFGAISTRTVGKGNAGDLTVDTKQLTLSNGGQLLSDTSSLGNAGTLTVRATEFVEATGTTTDGENSSGLFTESKSTDNRNAGNAGNLTITTQRLILSNGAQLSTATRGAGQGGDATINAPESVKLIGSSLSTRSGSSGNSGNLTITTGKLTVLDGTEVTTSSGGEGRGGNLTVNASELVEVGGSDSTGLVAGSLGTGDAGKLTINTKRLIIRDRAGVSVSNFLGMGGTLSVNATDSVELKNGSFLSADTLGAKPGGNLTVTTSKLIVQDRASVSTGNLSLFSEASGGTLTVKASDFVELTGGNLIALSLGDGGAGDIKIETDKLIVRNGAQVTAITRGGGQGGSLEVKAPQSIELIGTSVDGQSPSSLSTTTLGAGDAGDLKIDTGRLIIQDGAQVTAGTGRNSEGQGGNLTVRATNFVELSGTTADGQFPTGLTTQTVGSGSARNLSIETPKLIVRDGARVSTSTSGKGRGGNLVVTAPQSVEIVGASADSQLRSQLITNAFGSGAAGDLTIATARLSVRDGAFVSSGTFNEGQGGKLTVTASNSVELSGTTGDRQYRSGLFVETFGAGSAQDLRIETDKLVIRDSAILSSQSSGDGNAGNIFIQTNSFSLSDSASLSSESNSNSKAGNIFINARDTLQANNNVLIATGSQQTGGGDININAGNIQFSETTVATSAFTQAESGDINVNARDIKLLNNSNFSTISYGIGGNIGINARNLFLQGNSGIFTASLDTSSLAQGGNITISAEDIRLRENSPIITRSLGGGGNIKIDSNIFIALEDSDILANAGFRNGGNITIDSPVFLADIFRTLDNLNLFRGNDRVDISASSALGVSGTITVPDFSFLQNSLTELPQTPIDTNALIANSCIARSNKQEGTFTITGSGGLPNRPGDVSVSSYPTGDVRKVQDNNSSRSWQKGDPIVEPQGVYQLPSGQLVLSRECRF